MTPFWKYHGLGNDFVVVDRRGRPDISRAVSRAVCDRHTGVGADGILGLYDDPDVSGRLFMRVFNADGSVADMCGNGLRCFVRWLVEEIGVAPRPMVVGTDAGPQACIPVLDDAERLVAVSVNLGSPRFAGPADVVVGGRGYTGEDLFLGNPHYVILRAPDPGEAGALGPGLSTHERFPRDTNVEWLDVRGSDEAAVVIYERGCGLTRACGTGGGGAAAVGVRLGLLAADTDLRIEMPGGTLRYRVAADFSEVWMTGPAEPVFRGELPGDL